MTPSCFEVACCPLAELCQRLCSPTPGPRGRSSSLLGQRPSSSHGSCDEPQPEEPGIPHFGEAASSFSDLSRHLPAPNLDAPLAGLAAFEAAVQDLLAEPAGKALCDAYGGREGCLLRFLEARDSDVKRASAMIRATAAWRYGNEVNSLATMAPSDVRSKAMTRMRAYWPGHCVGLTKDGSPLLYTNVRDVTPRLLDFDEESLRLLYLGWMERSLQLQTVGRQRAHEGGCSGPGRPAPLPQNIEVFDFGGMSSWQLARMAFMLATSARFLMIGVTHYPEHLRTCFIINTPAAISVLSNLVLNRLPPATRSKVHVTSHSNHQAFQKFMEPEQVEAMLGFSVHPTGNHSQAIVETKDMMASWKSRHGLKHFAEL